jgi:protein SCO1
MKLPRILPWLLLAAGGGLLAGAIAAHMLAQRGPELQGGTWLPEARSLPALSLTDLDGKGFDPGQPRGHPALLFLGYSNCPDVCPTTLATLRAVLHAAPLPGLRVLFLSVDPGRDTPAQLRAYLDAFGPGFVGLYAGPGQLAPLQRALGAAALRESLPGGGYTLEHSATLYLLDTRGRLVAVFSPPLSAAMLTADLRRVAQADVL